MDEDDASALIGLIYEAALDERLWVAVMVRLAVLVGGTAIAFIRKDLATGQGRGVFGSLGEGAFAEYFGHFARRNPLAAAIGDMPAGSFLIDWQVMPKTALMRSEYYNDFLLKRDIHAVLGLMVWRDGKEVAIMNLARSPRDGDYQVEHAERLRPFMPHIRRAIALSRRLPARLPGVPDLDERIETWRDALILLDEAGMVHYVNREAERILARRDGLALVNGRLGAADPAGTRRLQAAIRAASLPGRAARGDGFALRRATGRSGYAVLVMPSHREDLFLIPRPVRVILAVSDLDAPRAPESALLREIFGLSRAQAGVAALLAAGREVKEIAATLGISLYTVRRHVADIMNKTETNRQAELVGLLNRLPGGH